MLRLRDTENCLRVAQTVGQCLQRISSEMIFIKKNMVMCWAASSLSEGGNIGP
jgi:hypothetical protein